MGEARDSFVPDLLLFSARTSFPAAYSGVKPQCADFCGMFSAGEKHLG